MIQYNEHVINCLTLKSYNLAKVEGEALTKLPN